MFELNDECEHAFGDLKQSLLTAPVLAVYDPEWPCEVWCDASAFAVGAVLL